MTRYRRELTVDEKSRLEEFYARPRDPAPPRAPTPRHPLRALLDRPMVDPKHRTITLFCWQGLAGAVLGMLVLPVLWLVMAICVAVHS